MIGTKAAFLDQWARENKKSFLRFDYSGHGESDGKFEAGSIGEWAEDAKAAIQQLTSGPLILIGSSMGAWIATLAAVAHPYQVAGIIFIAPAPDFTEKLMWPGFSDAQRQTMLREGRLEQPSDYSDEPEIITLKLIEDGRNHQVMNNSVAINAPVRIFQGMNDEAVPWRHALDFAELIESDDVQVILTKSGDHRLSSQSDLKRLQITLEALIYELSLR